MWHIEIPSHILGLNHMHVFGHAPMCFFCFKKILRLLQLTFHFTGSIFHVYSISKECMLDYKKLWSSVCFCEPSPTQALNSPLAFVYSPSLAFFPLLYFFLLHTLDFGFSLFLLRTLDFGFSLPILSSVCAGLGCLRPDSGHQVTIHGGELQMKSLFNCNGKDFWRRTRGI